MRPFDPARRGALRMACGHCVGLSALLSGLAHGQTAAPSAPAAAVPATGALADAALPPRFSRPAIDSDEGGLWAMMDREEAKLRRSPLVLRGTDLGRHLQRMACTLGADHCPDVRVYVVRTPLFNASMAPNGMMQIWTGLLLRVENEAQLAAVIGHEIGHYLERHSIERLRDVKNRAAFAQFIGLFGAVGLIGQLATMAGMFAFSREHETRADRLGMRLMQDAGYDGREAAKVWDNLLAELQVTGGSDVGKRSPMFATHPPVESRRDDLSRLARPGAGTTGTDTLRELIAPHRLDWVLDEVRRGQFEESLALFSRMVDREAQDGLARFARGETYRQRNAPDDGERAEADLSAASGLPGAPSLVFRSLGLLHRQKGQRDQAREAFQRYLSAAPHAGDAPLITSYVEEMKP